MSLVGFKARNHPQQNTSPDIDDRETAPEVFDPLHERFGFTIDVAASPDNAKLPCFYTSDDDGLACAWDGERVWCNPPYSNIRPWIEKAWWSWSEGVCDERTGAELIVMLLPANRTEQGWWQDLVEPLRDEEGGNFHVEFLRGRLRFINRETARTESTLLGDRRVGIRPNERPPFGCCLLIWEQGDGSEP